MTEELKLFLSWLIHMRDKYEKAALESESETVKERYLGKTAAYQEVVEVVRLM